MAFSPTPFHRIAAVLFTSTVLVRFYGLFQLADSPYLLPESGDMRFYYDWALRILHGEWSDGKAFYGLPGYPFLLAGIFFIAGPEPLVMGLLQAFLDGGIAVLLLYLSKLLWGERGQLAGMLAACAWMLLVPSQAFGIILMPTSWAVFAFWCLVAWAIRGDTRLFAWLVAGVVTGLTAVMVATILFLIPLVVFRAVQLRGYKWGLIGSVIFITGLGSGLAPCWVHNYFVAKEPVLLSAHSGINFYLGNNPVANGYPRIPPGLRSGQEGMLRDSLTVAESEILRSDPGRDSVSRAEVSEYWSEKARRFIRDEPKAWAELMLIKAGNFWNHFVYDDLSVITPMRERGIILSGISFGILALLAVPGILPAVRESRRAWWIVAAIGLHFLALMPVFVTERYRLAAAPGLALLAAYGVVSVVRALRRRELALPGAWLAMCGVWSLVVFAPRTDPALAAVDFYNSGIVYLREGDLEMAERKLRASEQLVPDNVEMQFALGNLAVEQGDPARARTYYNKTLALTPDHKGALNNLGFLALDDQDFRAAQQWLTRSLAVEPEDAKTWYLLARARRGLGDVEGALKAAGKARALRPEQAEFQVLHEDLVREKASRLVK